MKQRIKEIIKELKEVIVEEKLIIGDNILFAEAVSTYRGEIAGQNKNNFNKTFPKPFPKKENNSKPTSKQIYYIKTNMPEINTDDLNFQEATKLISENKKGN